MPENETAATDGLPEDYQRALLETVVDLDVITELVRRNLEDEEVRRVLHVLSGDDRDAFVSKLSALLRKTAALLVISRRLSDSLHLGVLLPRLVELISDFLDAERCSVFLYDPKADELYTKAAVGLAGEIRFPAGLGIAGTVFTSGEPLLVPDVYADSRFNPEIDGRTGFRTRNLLCVPLKHLRSGGPETVGVIQVLNKRPAPFGIEDLKLLEALCAPAAAALANALLHEEVQKARTEQHRLLELTSAISKEIELRTLLRKIVGTAVMVLEAERVTLFVQDRKTKELWALAGESGGRADTRPPSHPELAASVFATGQAINTSDPGSDPRFDAALDRLARSRTRNVLCLPVRGRGGDVVAVAEALNKLAGPFTAADERHLEAFCTQAAIAMETARLLDDLNVNVAHLRSLLDASKALAAPIDLDSQLSAILLRARDVMEAERSNIFIYDEAGATLSKRSGGNAAEDGTKSAVARGIAGHAAQARTLLNVKDAAQDGRFDPEVDQAPGCQVRSVLCAPLFSHSQRLIGVLQVLNKAGDTAFTPHDEALMEAFASHAAVALDRARLIEAYVEKQRIEHGLRMAHEIQMAMLPRVFPKRRELDLCARLVPARAVGGDFYDFVAEAERVWFVIGDVAGKGVGAALFMAMTKALLRASIGTLLTPSEVLSRVDRELGRDGERTVFVTVFAGCLNLKTGELVFSNAGHNAPYWLGKDGSVKPLTQALGVPLGILDDHLYETASLRLKPGDSLFLYTDGVTEAFSREGKDFSLERLERWLEHKGAAGVGAYDLVEGAFQAVKAFTGDAPQSDDITVLALRYLPA